MLLKFGAEGWQMDTIKDVLSSTADDAPLSGDAGLNWVCISAAGWSIQYDTSIIALHHILHQGLGQIQRETKKSISSRTAQSENKNKRKIAKEETKTNPKKNN